MNLKAKKKFGQNFLKNNFIIQKIVEDANIKNKHVIEIGPGKGALTALLLKKAKIVQAYEIDKDLIPLLNKRFSSFKNFELINEDFLNAKIKKRINIVANIPYNITSPIIFKIFENIENIETATLMVQAEVAKRFYAKPGSKNYGKLSVVCNFFSSDIKSIIKVPRIDFKPSPKVDSEVVQFAFKKQMKYSRSQQKQFLDFIKMCFFSQRKTLINNLLRSFEKQKIMQVFDSLKLDKKIRPQQINLEQYLNFWKAFN